MERQKEIRAAAQDRIQVKNNARKVSSWVIITIIILLALLTAFLGYQYRSLLFPKSLALSSNQDIKARFVIDAIKPYHIGDLLPVTLVVEARKSVTFQMPDLEFPDQGKIDLKQKSDIKKENRRGGFALSVQYLLTCWDVGKYDIPVRAISYKSKAGTGTSKVPDLKFEIVSLLPKNKSADELLALPLKTTKKPMGLPPNYQYLWWSQIGVIIIALIFLLVKYLTKIWPKKAVESVAETVSLEPAHVIALRRLEALLKEEYPERGEYKAFYSELSECIREYMENRFDIRALEMTTEEFLDHLTNNACLQYEHQVVLREFLYSSDLVKFAKYVPSHEETDTDFGKARQLIEETKETPVIPAEQVSACVEEDKSTNSVLPGE